MSSSTGKPARKRRVTSVVVGAHPSGGIPGRIVVTDPALRRKLSPPPSREAIERIEELERGSARAMARMRDILLD